jgi:hypothetical protein
MGKGQLEDLSVACKIILKRILRMSMLWKSGVGSFGGPSAVSCEQSNTINLEIP